MKEEILNILKMVEEKKITAEDADKLIEALEAEPKLKTKPAPEGKYLRIKVDTLTGDKVNLKIPLGVFTFVSKHLPKQARIALEEEDIDIEEMMELISEGKIGEVLDVETGEGKKVNIWIE